MSTAFMQQLIRTLYADDRVLAAYLGGDLTGPSPDQLERIDLHLSVEPGFRDGLADWLAPLGETAYSGPDKDGWRVITMDGVEWVLHLASPHGAPPSGDLQPLFDREPDPPDDRHHDKAESGLDLVAVAGAFWSDLYRAAGALGRRHSLTAHGWLEECRRGLIDLYRLALSPGHSGRGWEGADAVPGLLDALGPGKEWLVAPLDSVAQWRSAHRLAVAYESLMLPLCQRLSLPYPMAMRNLAFRRLELARPDQRRSDAVQPEPSRPDQGDHDSGQLNQVSPNQAPSPGADRQSLAPHRPGRMRLTRGRIQRD